MSLCKLYCSSKTVLPLNYILMSTFCFSFVRSGLVWPVSAQIFILYWHITAHNILRKRVSWYITLTFEQQNLFFRLLSGVAALPRVIKARGRLESHNYVWIDSWLSCPCLEPGSMEWRCLGAVLPPLLSPACPSLHAWQGRCTLTSGVAPCVPGVVHWVECSRWKDKSSVQCQGLSCEVLNRLVKDALCCTGNVSDFFVKL